MDSPSTPTRLRVLLALAATLFCVGACDIYEGHEPYRPTPDQTRVAIFAEPADSVAVGDTLTLRAAILEKDDPDTFTFTWRSLRGRSGGVSPFVSVDGRTDGPVIQYVGLPMGGRTRDLITVIADNGSRDSLAAEDRIFLTVIP